MPNALMSAWWRTIASALAMIFVGSAMPIHAHVIWDRVNSVDSNTISLYHFDDVNGNVAAPVFPLSSDLGLTVFNGQATLSPTGDTPGTIFNPQALNLPVTQTLRTTETVSGLAGDLTIECWFKWSPSMTSATLELGLQSGARILVARDTFNPANDRFGIAGTHGSFVDAPGFPNWQNVGEEEAGLNEWRHLALAIHSNGIHYDPVEAHDVYSTGTTGRIYLNGHPQGFDPFTINLAGLKVHDTSGITIIMRGGGMVVDEVTLWKRDWSDNGVATNPFANGRGAAAVDNWIRYNEHQK